MDLGSPHLDLGMGATGDVVVALWSLREGVSGREVARRSGRSPAQVALILRDLVGVGLVDERSAAPAVLYSFNRDHVLAPVVGAVIESRHVWLQRLSALIDGWQLAPVAAVVFGSAARREAGPDSDVDVALVRPDNVDLDDITWQDQILDLVTSLRRWVGNDISVIDPTMAELRKNRRLDEDIRAEGIVVAGSLDPVLA